MDIRLIAGTLPPDYCIKNGLQEFYNLMFAQGYGQLDTTASIALIIVSSTEPTADQRDYLWHRINPATGAFDKTYKYTNGVWASPYRIPPESPERMFWTGTAEALKTYDGGDTQTVGQAAGPFWEVDTEMSARFLAMAGTMPGEGGTVIAAGKGGSEAVVLTKDNLPAATVDVDLPIIGQATVGTANQPVVNNIYGKTDVGGSGRAVDATNDDFAGRYNPLGRTKELGKATPLKVVPLYYGLLACKRTIRRYWVPV